MKNGIQILACLCAVGFIFRGEVCAQASYDDCGDAYEISKLLRPACETNASSLTVNKTFRLNDAQSSPFPPLCFNFQARKDIWLTFEAPESARRVVLGIDSIRGCGSGCSTDFTYAIYESGCTTEDFVRCDRPVPIIIPVKPGLRYYIRIWELDGEDMTFRLTTAQSQTCCFDVCETAFTFPVAAPSPNCQTLTRAVPVALNIPFSLLNKLPCAANADGTPPPEAAACGLTTKKRDMWFAYQNPFDAGGVAIELTGIGGCEGPGCKTDVGYVIYEGDACWNLKYLTCGRANDGFISGGSQGIIIAPGVPGAKIWIQLFETDNEGTRFTVGRISGLPRGETCVLPAPLAGGGCNVGAYPDNFVAPGADGAACCWVSNENTTFYSFDVTPATPQPVSLTAFNVQCGSDPGGLQLAIYKADCAHIGGADSNKGFYGCACGTGSVTLTPNAILPTGKYIVAVDGDAGDCRWEFAGVVVSDAPFTKFEGELDDNHIKLVWETFGQTRNVGFEVQRSFDAVSWTRIAYIPSEFDPAPLKSYGVDDYDLRGDVQYYRLKIIDNDGIITYTNIVEVSLKNALSKSFTQCYFFPHPADEQTALHFNLRLSGAVRLKLFDAVGRIRYDVTRSLPAGSNVWELSAAAYPTGIYSCTLENGSESATLKLTVR